MDAVSGLVELTLVASHIVPRQLQDARQCVLQLQQHSKNKASVQIDEDNRNNETETIRTLALLRQAKDELVANATETCEQLEDPWYSGYHNFYSYGIYGMDPKRVQKRISAAASVTCRQRHLARAERGMRASRSDTRAASQAVEGTH